MNSKVECDFCYELAVVKIHKPRAAMTCIECFSRIERGELYYDSTFDSYLQIGSKDESKQYLPSLSLDGQLLSITINQTEFLVDPVEFIAKLLALDEQVDECDIDFVESALSTLGINFTKRIKIP